MKIKYKILGNVLSLLFMVFVATDICAQKEESWIIYDLDDFSLSVPKHLNEHNLNQEPRKIGGGYTSIRHGIRPYDRKKGERKKELFWVEIYKYTNQDIASVEWVFSLEKKTYKRLFNAKIKKRNIQNDCDLHYVITYESRNPFDNKTSRMYNYQWLYKRGNAIFALIIKFNENEIIDMQSFIQTINKIQSTFILK